MPISRPVQARLRELDHHEPDRARHRRAQRRRRRHVLPDRRPVHRRVARADARGRARREGRGRVDAARRRVQAAHLAVRVPGPGRPRRWRSSPRRARRPACRWSPSCSTPQHAEAIAEHADVVQIGARNMQNYALLEVAGKLGKPVLLKRGLSSSLDELLQAADYILKEGNEAVDPVRARHPHLRDRDALHARPRRGAVAEAAHPPAGDRRPVARRRRPPPGRAAVARGGRRRRRRHHRRGPPGPRGGAVRRPAGAVRVATSPTTRATSPRTRRCSASGWPSRYGAPRWAGGAARRLTGGIEGRELLRACAARSNGVVARRAGAGSAPSPAPRSGAASGAARKRGVSDPSARCARAGAAPNGSTRSGDREATRQRRRRRGRAPRSSHVSSCRRPARRRRRRGASAWRRRYELLAGVGGGHLGLWARAAA